MRSTFDLSGRPICFDCNLSLKRKNVVLPEIVGDDPKIAFWGMGPGTQEDKHGRPFVGPAGELLRASLKQLGIHNYQLLNSVLCLLPGNIEPNAYQAQTCSPHVRSFIAPTVEIIVLLGRVALRSAQGKFTLDLSINKNRGKLIMSQLLNIPCIATYHPSYILRQNLSAHDFHIFLEDIKRAQLYIEA